MSLPVQMPHGAERPFLQPTMTPRQRTYRRIFVVVALLALYALYRVFSTTPRVGSLWGMSLNRPLGLGKAFQETSISLSTSVASHGAESAPPMPDFPVPSRTNPAEKYAKEHLDLDSQVRITSDSFPAQLSDSIKVNISKAYPVSDPHKGELPAEIYALLDQPPQLTPPPKPKPAPQFKAENWTYHPWTAERNGSRTTPADAERPASQAQAHDWRPPPFAGWSSPVTNLSRASQALPRVQYAFEDGQRFSGNKHDTEREQIIAERRRLVRNGFIRAWQGYKTCAWGADELRPVSCKPKNNFNGWGATIVDSLDTLLVMGLHEEYNFARSHVYDIDFHLVGGSRSAYGSADGRVPVFETAIRYLGGLLSAYDLSGDVLMKERAEELAQLIMPAFETYSGLPVGRMRIDDPHQYTVEEPRGKYERIVLAEATSMLLEFTRLWQVTGNRTYFDTVQRVTDFLDRNATALSRFGTLLPIGLYMQPLQLVGKYTFGGMADSYYEYLIKEHQLLGGRLEQYPRMFSEAMDSAIKFILRRIRVVRKAPSLIVAASSTSRPLHFGLKLEHLSCFTGAMFALSSKLLPTRRHDLNIARRYTETCWWMYNSTLTGLGPEEMVFFRPEDQDRFEIIESEGGALVRGAENGYPLQGVRTMNGVHQNRPEAIESVLYMWRVTGDEVWRERGWQMFSSWMTHALTEVGVSSIDNVMRVPPRKTDGQESFALAETFKYYYLLFSPPDLISLDDFVLTTEAHPLLVPKNGSWREAGSRVPLLKPWSPPPPPPSDSYTGGENGLRGGMTNTQKHEYANALRTGPMRSHAEMAFANLRNKIDKMLATSV